MSLKGILLFVSPGVFRHSRSINHIAQLLGLPDAHHNGLVLPNSKAHQHFPGGLQGLRACLDLGKLVISWSFVVSEKFVSFVSLRGRHHLPQICMSLLGIPTILLLTQTCENSQSDHC